MLEVIQVLEKNDLEHIYIYIKVISDKKVYYEIALSVKITCIK